MTDAHTIAHEHATAPRICLPCHPGSPGARLLAVGLGRCAVCGQLAPCVVADEETVREAKEAQR